MVRKKQTCLWLILCLLCVHAQPSLAKKSLAYDFDIHADFSRAPRLTADDDCIPVKVQISQSKHLLRELSWEQNEYLSQFSADGALNQKGSEWQWEVPKRGGELRYCARLNHLRGDRYDARITKSWALFRADDLFPAASSVVRRGSFSRTRLHFQLPKKWSSVTAYPELSEHVYEVDNPTRLFDRPTGWVQLGELGVRRNQLAGTQVAVAAPVGQEVTRLEILTLLTFTMRTVREWFPNFPERLLIVSAVDGMWRGALSGPASLFLHGERPLISENGTSTMLHELVHVAMQREATKDADWIDEGLAEYLSLVLLHKAGGLTKKRFQDSLVDQQEWGKSARLAAKNSSGAATAKAVTVFAQLHTEIGDQHFRQLIQQLATPGPAISPESLRKLAEAIAGKAVVSLP